MISSRRPWPLDHEAGLIAPMLIIVVKGRFLSAFENIRSRDKKLRTHFGNCGFPTSASVQFGCVMFALNFKTHRQTDLSCRVQYDGRKLEFCMQFVFLDITLLGCPPPPPKKNHDVTCQKQYLRPSVPSISVFYYYFYMFMNFYPPFPVTPI